MINIKVSLCKLRRVELIGMALNAGLFLNQKLGSPKLSIKLGHIIRLGQLDKLKFIY